ncbi:thiamine kinase [Pantoea sp.]|uniref:thiamine kinase n=1 Tax=Pantoea sp. TaxID=69393 RepID=UPI00289DE0E1|nr:thiamine kinase [Pantoea sp.]
MTHKIDPALRRLLDTLQPAAEPAGCFLSLAGLTGGSGKVETAAGPLLARRQPPLPIPFVNRRREYRILKKLRGSGLTPQPLAVNARWLLLRWQPGATIDQQDFTQRQDEVLALLGCLHQQPLTGYRLRLLPLLQQYWQLCRERDLRWQRALRRLTRAGEPKPLRLAPIHMDVHPGNLIASQQALRLIDWEYAADGDVALEIAALCAADPAHRQSWITLYARQAGLPPRELETQVKRWQPWLRLLMASWYQLRAEQSGDAALRRLAAESWQSL